MKDVGKVFEVVGKALAKLFYLPENENWGLYRREYIVYGLFWIDIITYTDVLCSSKLH